MVSHFIIVVLRKFLLAAKKRKSEEDREKLIAYKKKLGALNIKEERGMLTSSVMNTKSNSRQAPSLEARRLVSDASEYWEYLHSAKTWDLQRDGLIAFVIDSFHEISKRNWMTDERMADVLMTLRSTLLQIDKALFRVEEQLEISVSKFALLIRECLDSYPDKKLLTFGKKIHVKQESFNSKLTYEQQEREKFIQKPSSPGAEEYNTLKPQVDVFAVVAQKIKEFITAKKVTIDDF